LSKGEATQPRGRLVAVEIDPQSIASRRSFIDDERAIAIRDLIADNVFAPIGRSGDRFRLRLSLVDRKLVLEVGDADGGRPVRHIMSLTPLRRVIKDYFIVCDAYYAAVGSASRARIEAIDAGRRGLHNEGAEILRQRLGNKIIVDMATARRLFTLVAALHWKG